MTTAQANLEQFSPIEMPQGQLMAAGEETVVQESIQQERNHLLGAHVTEFARNSMRRIATGAAVCAAAFGASEMANPATAEAKSKPISPDKVLTGIIKVHNKYEGKNSIDPVRATLTGDRLILKGTCANRRIYYKSAKYTPEIRILDPCVRGVKDHTSRNGDGLYEAHSYSTDLDKLGSRVAKSTGVSKASHGLTTKITATKRSARISFEPIATASESASGKQLQTLIIRKGKKPVEEWYDASELAKAAPEASQIAE